MESCRGSAAAQLLSRGPAKEASPAKEQLRRAEDAPGMWGAEDGTCCWYMQLAAAPFSHEGAGSGRRRL